MAENDKSISQLEERAALTGNEMVPFAESGKNGKVKSSLLKGQKGDNGADGKSAYQAAVEGGYTGTEAEFSKLLSGLPEQAEEVTKLGTQVTKNTGDISAIKERLDKDEYYGIEFDTTVSSPTCTRIGKTELHKSLPVQSGMRGCLLDDDGNVVEYLDPNDWTGNVRDGSRGQVMVEIPTHYRKFETEGTKRRVLLSMSPQPGYRQVPKSYVSAYQATVQRSTGKLASVVNDSTDYRGGNNNAGWDGTYRSLLGVPATNISRTNFSNYARKRKEGSTEWNCMVYSMQKTLYWLFVVEYATLNSQAAYNSEPTSEGFKQGGLGDGVTNINSGKWNSFNSQNPFIPCGFTDSLGNGTGIVPFTMPTEYNAERVVGGGTSTVTNVPRYRGVENPFGHIWQWTDGINVRISPTEDNGGDNLSKVFVCENPAYFKDNGYDGYNYVGDEARENGYVKEIIFGDSGEIMPSLCTGGGSTTYFCDYHYTNVPTAETLRGVLFGGVASHGASAGFAFAYSHCAPSLAHATVGSRLCFLPESA